MDAESPKEPKSGFEKRLMNLSQRVTQRMSNKTDSKNPRRSGGGGEEMEDKTRLVGALLGFVERVTNEDKATSETEIAVLPQVAKVLAEILYKSEWN
ncbi:hypothetical protein HMPREF0262_00425 [Clostridium sp. ATCC 29733]|nr:hypothetical protein HMPREF0262_00425 [Clostridium sp. ATCC 29733]